MEVKAATIFYKNISKKLIAWTNRLNPPYLKIHHTAFIEINNNKISQPILKPLLTLGHRGDYV